MVVGRTIHQSVRGIKGQKTQHAISKATRDSPGNPLCAQAGLELAILLPKPLEEL